MYAYQPAPRPCGPPCCHSHMRPTHLIKADAPQAGCRVTSQVYECGRCRRRLAEVRYCEPLPSPFEKAGVRVSQR